MLKVQPASTQVEPALKILRAHRILAAAPDDVLHEMLRNAQIVTAAPRDTLFHQGDAGRSVAIVLAGFVKLSSYAPSGRELILEICGPGSLFGELAALNGWTRAATATSLSSTQVLSIRADAFRATLVRSPDAMLALVGVLSRRLAAATELIRDGALPGPARLAKALSQLVATHGHPEGSGLQLDIALSQRELGSMTGLSRETINKQLAQWREQGWIEITAHDISLRDTAALRDVIEQASE